MFVTEKTLLAPQRRGQSYPKNIPINSLKVLQFLPSFPNSLMSNNQSIHICPITSESYNHMLENKIRGKRLLGTLPGKKHEVII